MQLLFMEVHVSFHDSHAGLKHQLLVVSGQALHELEALLMESVASQQEAAKLCAAQWASRLFQLSHVPSRYVCVIAAGDAKLEVREAGSAGLQRLATTPSGELTLGAQGMVMT